MVELRNLLRNYEPIGMPMLALIQVKRVFLPRKPGKVYCNASKKGNNEERDGVETETKPLNKHEKHEEEIIPRFKITKVLVGGLDTEPSKKTILGDPMLLEWASPKSQFKTFSINEVKDRGKTFSRKNGHITARR